MKTSTKDQVEGKLHQVKGEIKETVGKLINDFHLKAEGNVEKKEGQAQEKGRSNKENPGKVKSGVLRVIHYPFLSFSSIKFF